MVFFGKYKGTFRETGFYWVNPFITKKKLSMRSRNLDVKPIKVNDKAGNPIMIGLVLIWKLNDTYKAMFDIDSQTMATSNPASGTASVGIQTVSSRMNAFEAAKRLTIALLPSLTTGSQWPELKYQKPGSTTLHMLPKLQP